MPVVHPRPYPLPTDDTRIAAGALDLLRRHPGSALATDRLRELLHLEGAEAPEESELLVRMLSGQSDLFHLILPRRRRWAGSAPRRWVLVNGGDARERGHPLLVKLRRTLRCIGRAVDEGSAREIARWERYLLEEGAVRLALERRLRRMRRRNRTRITDPVLPLG